MISKMYLDCRKPLPFKDNSVDLIITDPPWSFWNRFSDKSKQVKASNYDLLSDEEIGFSFSEFYRILKEGSHFYCFTPWAKIYDCIRLSKLTQWNIPQILFWDKMRIGLGHLYRNQVEMIVLMSKGKRKPIKSKSIPNIFRFKPPGGSMKPPEVYEIFVEQSSDPGQTILDPFSGSAPLGRIKQNQTRNLILGDILYENGEKTSR